MQALVPLELVLGLEIWLTLRVLAIWPSTSANYSLVLLFWQDLNCEWVEDISLLVVKLVIRLVVETSF